MSVLLYNIYKNKHIPFYSLTAYHYKWHYHCGTNNTATLRTLTDPCKAEVRPGAQEESASPAWLAAPAMNARDTTKVYMEA